MVEQWMAQIAHARPLALHAAHVVEGIDQVASFRVKGDFLAIGRIAGPKAMEEDDEPEGFVLWVGDFTI